MPHKKTPSYPFSTGPNAVSGSSRPAPLPPASQSENTNLYVPHEHTDENEESVLLEAADEHDYGHEEEGAFMSEEVRMGPIVLKTFHMSHSLS